jgi:hypothetical protein
VFRSRDLSAGVKQLTVPEPDSECSGGRDFISDPVRRAVFLKMAQVKRIQEFIEEGEFTRDRVFLRKPQCNTIIRSLPIDTYRHQY